MAAVFHTEGICRFSPPLNKRGETVRRDGKTTDWWLVLECDPELGRYLRQLFFMHHHKTESLQEPLWGTHVTVIRDEQPPNLELWKSIESETFSIHYGTEITVFDEYVFLPVECPAALDYREQLGLPREPEYPLHMTFGNMKPMA